MTATSNPGADTARPHDDSSIHDRHLHHDRGHDPAVGDLKAGRRRVARSRGALSGILLLVLGVWSALIPFVGPYFNFAFAPRPDDAWHWTSGRGLYELLPGGIAALAGIVLLVSASRALTVFMAWLAALSGAWLVVAPSVDRVLNVGIGAPDATGDNKTAALELLYFFAVGVAIALIAGIALGRLSTHSVRDVRAAERRAEAEAAEQRRLEAEQAQRAEQQRRSAEATTAADAAERRHGDARDHEHVPDRDRPDGHADRAHDHGHRADADVRDTRTVPANDAPPAGAEGYSGQHSHGHGEPGQGQQPPQHATPQGPPAGYQAPPPGYQAPPPGGYQPGYPPPEQPTR